MWQGNAVDPFFIHIELVLFADDISEFLHFEKLADGQFTNRDD